MANGVGRIGRSRRVVALAAVVLLAAGCQRSLAIGTPIAGPGGATYHFDELHLQEGNSVLVYLGKDDFTIELWLRTTTVPASIGGPVCSASSMIFSHRMLVNSAPEETNVWTVGLTASGQVAFEDRGGFQSETSPRQPGLTICTSFADGRVHDGKWHHVAVERVHDSGLLQIWFDGALAASGIGYAGDQFVWPQNLTYIRTEIGANPVPGKPQPYQGSLDELRVSSTLRYAAPFTPQTTAFVGDMGTNDTELLYHLDGGTSAADGTIFFRGTAQAEDYNLLFGTLVDDAGVAVPQTFDPTQAGGPF